MKQRFISKVKQLTALSVLLAAVFMPMSAHAIDNTIYDNMSEEWRSRCFQPIKAMNENAIRIVGNDSVANVVVPDGCGGTYSLTTYKTHENPFPVTTQVAHAFQTVQLAPGAHTIRVPLPPAGCFFQTDLYIGGPVLNNTDDLGYYVKNELDAQIGGQRDCLVQPPVFTCDSFNVVTDTNRKVRVDQFTTTAKNGANFKVATVNWGDNTQQLTAANLVGQEHTFAQDGTYTITATATFTVNNEEKAVSGPNCVKQVTFETAQPPVVTTPTAPTKLVNTGPGEIAGIVAGITLAGAAAHQYRTRRKLNV